MKVLIACEFSGIIRDEFLSLGFDAISCDLIPTERPGPHYQGDVRNILGDGFDLMIAHPPCRYICLSGLHWNQRILGRQRLHDKAIDFVRLLMDAPIEHIAIENPIGSISRHIRKADQIIQPWQFGDPYSKDTALWLKNLPELISVDAIRTEKRQLNGRPRWENQTASGQNSVPNSAMRSRIRSRTFPGIAKAMATQWSEYLVSKPLANITRAPYTALSHKI